MVTATVYTVPVTSVPVPTAAPHTVQTSVLITDPLALSLTVPQPILEQPQTQFPASHPR